MRERIVRSVPAEILGYLVLAIGLAALLWSRIGDVDGFYLDEWLYVHASQYIWEHLPGGLVDQIPFWERGPQRLYSTLLSPLWGPLPTSTAYTAAHVLNVGLLVSAIVPTALLARRVIDSPALRVLAVALGTVVPWLMIGSHLLTENLAFPLYMWAVYAIVRCAEEPSLARQAGALGVIAALTLCRLNLGFVIAVLFVAVIVAEAMRRSEERDLPLRQWFLRVLKREALIVAACVVVAVMAAVLVVRGGSALSGHYGGLDFDTSFQRLFGETAGDTWRTIFTYLRGVVVGGFVFPIAIGFGVAFAGLLGRLGRRFVIPSLVALLGLAVVVIVVSTSTVGGALEERYVMYVYPPVAVLAVAGLPEIYRIRYWLIPGGAAALYLLAEGIPSPSFDAGNFFAAPAGAFWSRVVQHRLVGWEDDLFGWLSIDPRGWLLIGLGLVAMLVFVVVAGRRGHTRVIVPTLATGLALCVVAQALVLNYGFKQELYGTVDAPGGIAQAPGHDGDRETWLDDQGDTGRDIAVMPGVVSPGARWGGAEVLQFWNRALDSTVALPWNGTVVPAAAGYDSVVDTQLGADGLARWTLRPQWLAAYRDDPRVQFPGRLVARSPVSRYGLYRTATPERALWTSLGLQPDGAVLRGASVGMTLDRSSAGRPPAVTLTLRAVPGATKPVSWRLIRDGRPVAAGQLRPNRSREVRLPVPDCPAGRRCAPVEWALRASGPAVGTPLPVFGAPGPPRPVLLYVDAVHIESRLRASAVPQARSRTGSRPSAGPSGTCPDSRCRIRDVGKLMICQSLSPVLWAACHTPGGMYTTPRETSEKWTWAT